MKSTRQFTPTDKSVFRDNRENVFYVDLNNGMRIAVENNPETMAIIAWNQSSLEHKERFILKFFNGKHLKELACKNWVDIPRDIQDEVIAYQTKKMN